MNAGLRTIGVVMVLYAALFIFDAVNIVRFDGVAAIEWHLQWGKEAAWVIRGGMMLLGLWLIFMTPRGDD